MWTAGVHVFPEGIKLLTLALIVGPFLLYYIVDFFCLDEAGDDLKTAAKSPIAIQPNGHQVLLNRKVYKN